VQWGDSEHLPEGADKPKMASLFKTMTLERMTVEMAAELLSLPRTLGIDPADEAPVVAANGRYGPYVQKGTESRSIDSEERLLTISLDEALQVLFATEAVPWSGCAQAAAQGVRRRPVSNKPIVAKEGRFGVYVTDGETNASLGRVTAWRR